MSDNLRLSVSKVKTFTDCKKKFKYSYVLRFPRKEFQYHTFGKFCHAVLENFHLAYINGSSLPHNEVMAQAFKKAWQEYKIKMTSEMKKEAWDISNQYLRKINQDKKSGKLSTVLACEKSFELKISDNIILNGFIDITSCDDDNVLHVADYKTTKDKKYLKDDWLQLLTYAYVLHRDNPTIKKVRCSYIMLRHNFEPITKEFSLDEIMTVEKIYADYAEKIRAEEKYEANPNFLCKYCEFLEFCEDGKKQVSPQLIFGEVNW